MAISARHVHLTQATVEQLFGAGHQLRYVRIVGPVGSVTIDSGVVCALRHIHMSTADAEVLGLKDQDRVAAEVNGAGRRLAFEDVIVRVAPNFRMELHLDTDEGNVAGVAPGMQATLLTEP